MEKNNMKRASTLPSECTTIIVGDQPMGHLSLLPRIVNLDVRFLRRLWATQHCQIISSLVSGEVLVSIALAWE